MRLIESPNSIRVHVPMELKRRSGRKRVVIPDDGTPDGSSHTTPITPVFTPEPTPADPQDIVVLTLARAFRWKRLLDEGKYVSIAHMSEALGINRWYLSRMIRLTLLAPDIVERIINGTVPDMSLERLRGPVPMVWERQRDVVGGGLG